MSHTFTTSLHRTRSWSRTKNPARVKIGVSRQHILACRLHLYVKKLAGLVGYIGNAPIQPGGFGFTDRTASLAEILSH